MTIIAFIKEVLRAFFKHKSPQVAGATSYFTIFSLPVVLVSIIWLVGQILGPEAAQSIMFSRLQPLVGTAAMEQVQTMIDNVHTWGTGGVLSLLLAAVGFIYGLAGAFLQLQSALDAAWHVRPDWKKGGLLRFAAKRLLSLLLLIAAALLMLVFFVASAIVTSFGSFMGNVLPPGVTTLILWGSNWLVSFGVIGLMLAFVYKVLPDALVEWPDVWLGAGITAALFSVGKNLIALVVSKLSPSGLFGAAGSVVILMIWLNISMMILLLGAEIIRVSARWRGRPIRPDGGAVQIRAGTDETEVRPRRRKRPAPR